MLLRNSVAARRIAPLCRLLASTGKQSRHTPDTRDGGPLFPTDYAQRASFLAAAAPQSHRYYPAFQPSVTWHSIPAFLCKFANLQPGRTAAREDEGEYVSVTGRIAQMRSMGTGLLFVDIVEGDAQMQLVFNESRYQGGAHWREDVADALQRGDIVEAYGVAVRTPSGELSLQVEAVNRLAPCLVNLPSAKHGMSAVDTCRTQRHLDLLSNPHKLAVFRTRARIISLVRSFLEDDGFLEVETPILSERYGGAVARPFRTRLGSLAGERPLFLRIAPELYLKQCIVAGIPRVYELGKVFRNEGTDGTHSPEFTSVEFYAAYQNADAFMSTVESLISAMAMRLHGKPSILVDSREIDLAPPYPIIEVVPFLERKLEVRLALDSHDKLRCQLLDALATNNGNSMATSANLASASLPKLFDLLISEHIEPLCWHPTYIAYHPRFMSPLAAPHPRNALLSDRFELFIQQTEIANAYSELNDPTDQALQFALHSKQHRVAGNAESEEGELPPADEHFLRVMQAGMPPTAGCGIGIDRLVMLMTGQRHIRDVTLFSLH